jgi:hypothetical protein
MEDKEGQLWRRKGKREAGRAQEREGKAKKAKDVFEGGAQGGVREEGRGEERALGSHERAAEEEERERREKQKLNATEFEALSEEQQKETALEALCGGRFQHLAASFKNAGYSMIVGDLKGYTKEELKAHVDGKGGPDGLVPPWLVEYGLEQFLRGAGEWVLFTCSFPQYAADITRTALPHHGLATSGEPGEQRRQPLLFSCNSTILRCSTALLCMRACISSYESWRARDAVAASWFFVMCCCGASSERCSEVPAGWTCGVVECAAVALFFYCFATSLCCAVFLGFSRRFA